MANQKEKRSEKMISEQDKQQILNGAYGITRNGTKVKYLFTSDINSEQNRYLFIEYVEQDGKVVFHNTLWLGKNFKFFPNSKAKNNLDVIGLWKDKPELFDLQRALAGEPVMLRDGNKGVISCNLYNFIKDNIKLDDMYPLKGIRFYKQNEHIAASSECWTLEGKLFVDQNEDSPADIIGMWKEPEPKSKTVTLTLPCPLKELKDEMWFIGSDGVVFKSDFQKDNQTRTCNMDKFNAGFYFGSEEDAQAWLDAMRNNRR